MTFQLTAARRRLVAEVDFCPVPKLVSTHSRPKAAGFYTRNLTLSLSAFQLTAARRRLVSYAHICNPYPVFQLTAARRRLDDE